MRLPTALTAACLCATAVPNASGPTASIAATVSITPRTSLSVSSPVLRFIVPDGSNQATAEIQFRAGVRAMPGVDVQLIAEPVVLHDDGSQGPEVDPALLFEGEGEGAAAGVLPAGSPGVVARWSGGGQRHGRIVFTLQRAAPGTYTIPVRLFLNVP